MESSQCSYSPGCFAAAVLRGLVFQVSPRLLAYTLARIAAKLPLLHALTAGVEWCTPASLTHELKNRRLLAARNAVLQLHWQPMAGGAIRTVYRVDVVYADGGSAAATGAPRSVVVKHLGATARDVAMGALLQLFQQEQRCFTVLSARVGDLQPRLYAHRTSWYGVGLLVMEDYGHLLHPKSSAGSGATFAQIKAMLEFAGELHGRTFMDAQLAERMRFEIPWVFHNLPNLVHSVIPRSRMAQTVEECGRLKAIMDRIADDRPFLDQMSAEIYGGKGLFDSKVFLEPAGPVEMATPGGLFATIHGDCRLDNAFFHPEGGVRMVDWQICAPRHPGAEIFWMLMDLDSDIAA